MSQCDRLALAVALAAVACQPSEPPSGGTEVGSTSSASSTGDGGTTVVEPATSDTGADSSTGEVIGTGTSTGEEELRFPRVVAIGDMHGDLDNAQAALMLAGAIDETGAWIGGDQLAIVQVGDLIDRGLDNRPLMDYMRQLAAEAEAAGGAIHSLLGNPETQNVREDQAMNYLAAYAHAETLAQFDDIEWDEAYIAQIEAKYGIPDPEDFEYLTYTEQELQTTPDEWKGHLTAYHPGGPYAEYFAERDVILILQRTLYVHGGVLPWHVEYGIDNINSDVRQWLLGKAPMPYDLVASSTDGPLWTRVLSDTEFEPRGDRVRNYCEIVSEVLTALDVDRMVVGHSVRYDLAADCDNQLIMIDVGMSSYYLPWGGGEIKMLEIVDGDQLAVIEEP